MALHARFNLDFATYLSLFMCFISFYEKWVLRKSIHLRHVCLQRVKSHAECLKIYILCKRDSLHMGVPHAIDVEKLVPCRIVVNNVFYYTNWGYLILFLLGQFQYLRILKCGMRSISSLLNEREVYLPIVWGLVSRFGGDRESRSIIGFLDFTSFH